MIKCVIFDFGRVIGNFDNQITCQRLTKFCDLSADKIYHMIFKSKLEKQYDEGLAWDKFYRQAKSVIGANRQLTSDVFAEIWGNIFSENPGIETVLAKIKPEIKILLLSNTNPVHWQYISMLSAIWHFFGKREQLILSFEVGARKPDSKIFLEGINRSGCQPSEILYVDDTQEYVAAFETLGGNGFIYNCEFDPIQKLEAELIGYKVIGLPCVDQ